MTPKAVRRLWTCPKCGNAFVSRNIYHACGQYHLADHFDGKPLIVRRTFDAWLEAARACGLVRALLRIETLTPNAHIHRFRLARPEDVDDALRALVREAYSVGKQEHLKRA